MGNKDQYGLAGLIAGVPVAAFQTAQADTPSAPLKPEPWVRLSDVLAALEAAPHVNETPKCAHDDADVLSTQPDLVEKAGKVLKLLSLVDNDGHTRFQGKTISEHASDTIRALIALCQAQAAQIAGLEAFIRNDADWKFSAKRRLELFREQRARAEAAEAEAHACGAERERWKERAEAAEAKVAGLTRKVKRIADEIDEQVKVTRAYVADCGMDHNQQELMAICTRHFIDSARALRAALEDKA